jgi:WD40 repeat protein
VRFAPDGEKLSYVVIGEAGEWIATWDVATRQQRKRVHKAESRIGDLAYSPDGRLLAMLDGPAVYSVDAENGDRTRLHVHEGNKKGTGAPEVNCVRFSSDGSRIVSADSHGFVKVWEVRKKAVAVEIRCVPRGRVTDVVLIPNTDQAVVIAEQDSAPDPKAPNVVPAPDHKELLADLKTGAIKPLSNPEPWELYPAAYRGSDASADGKRLAFPGGKGIQILIAATLKTEFDLECPLDPMVCRFSESGRLLFAGGVKRDRQPFMPPPPLGELAILDRTTNTWVSHLRVLDQEVAAMAFSAKHNLLAVSSVRTGVPITVWDLSPVTKSLPPGKK